MVSIAMVTIRRFSSQAESTGRHPALCCLWCIHSDRPLSGGVFFVREKAVLLSVKFLTVQMVDACLSEGGLLKKFCMVNPPVRRGDWCDLHLFCCRQCKRGFRDTRLDSPGGTRHHVHDDTDTQCQPLS